MLTSRLESDRKRDTMLAGGLNGCDNDFVCLIVWFRHQIVFTNLIFSKSSEHKSIWSKLMKLRFSMPAKWEIITQITVYIDNGPLNSVSTGSTKYSTDSVVLCLKYSNFNDVNHLHRRDLKSSRTWTICLNKLKLFLTQAEEKMLVYIGATRTKDPT